MKIKTLLHYYLGDVIRKYVPRTNFRKQEYKQTMASKASFIFNQLSNHKDIVGQVFQLYSKAVYF